MTERIYGSILITRNFAGEHYKAGKTGGKRIVCKRLWRRTGRGNGKVARAEGRRHKVALGGG